MSPILSDDDFGDLEHALTALREANSQSNAKSAELKAWFKTHTGQLVAVALINELKQVGNRLKEQRAKLAPYSLFFSADLEISDRTERELAKYVYPNLRAVFFFVFDGEVYKLRSIAIRRNGDAFASAVRQHYQTVDTVKDIDLPAPEVVTWEEDSVPAEAQAEERATSPSSPPLPSDDVVLTAVLDAASDGYAGVILVGPPGTGKSRYANLVADHLAEGDLKRREFVQFHPSYQYEDFIQGFEPTATSFKPQWKVFAKLCQAAAKDLDNTYVLVIDELSRTDTARVFGEALTYIEMDKRGRDFTLASGASLNVPKNLFILATMNPWDRGVDDVDIALERRFAEIPMMPSEVGLRGLLEGAELTDAVVEGVVAFFKQLQTLDNLYCRLGHAYFVHARNPEALERMWGFRLHPYFKRASRSDRGTLVRIESLWKQLVIDALHPPVELEAAPAEADER